MKGKGEVNSDLIPVHALMAEFPTNTKGIADFKKATIADMTSSLLMQTFTDGS